MGDRVTLKDKIFEMYIPEKEIVAAITDMAEKIKHDTEGKNPLFVGILNGAFMFVAELMSKMPPTSELTFAKYSSYHGTKSDGIVKELLPIPKDSCNRPIVIMEDIIDSGLTMQYVKKRLKEEGANDVRIATMLLKPDSLKCDLKPDYVGMEIENDFIVGFGLDYDGLGRTLRSIYKITENN